MKHFLLLLISSCFFISSCTTEDAEVSASQIDFKISKSNSNNNFEAIAQANSFKQINQTWQMHSDSATVSISWESTYEVILENGEKVEIAFWFHEHDIPRSKLILSEATPINSYGTKWKFNNFEKDGIDFFKHSMVRIIVESSNAIFADKIAKEMEVLEVEKLNIRGQEKIRLLFNFRGVAKGFYDPTGEFLDVYKIESGVFDGYLN